MHCLLLTQRIDVAECVDFVCILYIYIYHLTRAVLFNFSLRLWLCECKNLHENACVFVYVVCILMTCVLLSVSVCVYGESLRNYKRMFACTLHPKLVVVVGSGGGRVWGL